MLKIIVLGKEMFDETKNEFITVDDIELELEHSLVSLSKWESIYEIPFLDKEKKITEHIIGYVKCMTLTPDVIKRNGEKNSQRCAPCLHPPRSEQLVEIPKAKKSPPKC